MWVVDGKQKIYLEWPKPMVTTVNPEQTARKVAEKTLAVDHTNNSSLFELTSPHNLL